MLQQLPIQFRALAQLVLAAARCERWGVDVLAFGRWDNSTDSSYWVTLQGILLQDWYGTQRSER